MWIYIKVWNCDLLCSARDSTGCDINRGSKIMVKDYVCKLSGGTPSLHT